MIMTNDLGERYIYAVTKRMPHKVRDDISNELRALIEDMLAERCGEVMPAEKDIRVVLTELGSPNELYEKYSPDEKKSLIGGAYYSQYKFVLKIVLASVLLGMTVAFSVTQLTTPGAVWYEGLFHWLGMLWSGALSGFTWVTLLYAVFYRYNIEVTDNNFDLNDLPSVPNKKQTVSKWESIFDIGCSVLFLIVFLAAPRIICVIFAEPPRSIPIFNLETVHNNWYIIALFGIVGILREIVKLMEGCYNKKVMVTVIAANTVSAVLAFWWLLNDKLMNPEFIALVPTFFSGNDVVVRLFSNTPYFLLCVILFAIVWNTGEAVIKTVRN